MAETDGQHQRGPPVQITGLNKKKINFTFLMNLREKNIKNARKLVPVTIVILLKNVEVNLDQLSGFLEYF